MPRPPRGEALLDVRGDLGRQLLEGAAGGTPAARARGHLRREMPEPERLEDLLADPHLVGAIATRRGGQAHTDRVPDPLVEQDRSAAVVATMPGMPSPASVSPRWSG